MGAVDQQPKATLWEGWHTGVKKTPHFWNACAWGPHFMFSKLLTHTAFTCHVLLQTFPGHVVICQVHLPFPQVLSTFTPSSALAPQWVCTQKVCFSYLSFQTGIFLHFLGVFLMPWWSGFFICFLSHLDMQLWNGAPWAGFLNFCTMSWYNGSTFTSCVCLSENIYSCLYLRESVFPLFPGSLPLIPIHLGDILCLFVTRSSSLTQDLLSSLPPF